MGIFRQGKPVMLRPDLEKARTEVDNVIETAEDGELTIVSLLTGIRAELRYMNDRADAFGA